MNEKCRKPQERELELNLIRKMKIILLFKMISITIQMEYEIKTATMMVFGQTQHGKSADRVN